MIKINLCLWLIISSILSYSKSESSIITCDLSGTLLNSSTGECQKDCGTPNCLECLEQNKCQKCENDFYLDQNFKCNKECDLKNGYFANKHDLICQKCGVSNCLKCSGQNNCDVCIEGFTYSSKYNKCLQIECQETGGKYQKDSEIFAQEQEICSLKCQYFKNTNLEWNCDDYQTDDSLYYRIQQSSIQKQPIETIRYISKYKTLNNENIVIKIIYI